jgi:hypothetical protein
MTWTLVILILNTLPPRGIEVTGFKNEQQCVEQLQRFCDSSTEHMWRCKCLPPREGQT